ncbi:peptide-methionine (S)-S-oxide reductase MsrA [Roseomonas populi]|uniref:Peptide methionine sulfoxide reductase MsrA n=1 Tax=Roseomonas populi TaxID=3121582 RepID=A0ABT1WY78_9PROT|nr:peptide-methionine (S)-S-oxide reductase MsrA [Roseomonas pecuniae]MCR0980803.1 peptide-methionine (S)-S-oxide reductase MsrA [Roseomonas pecuniae]
MPRVDRRALLGLSAAATLGGLGLLARSGAAEEARALPAPALDQAGGTGRAVFAGGCFWGVQGVFQHTVGVTRAVSGYAGGDRASADYETVSTGRTGHAEAVEVTFDPAQVTYGALLQVFFSVAHDPTQLNRQGPDRGTQYRSAIFPADAEQDRIARAYIAQLDAARAFPAPIVTRIEADRPFFPAEAYHQDYMARHPSQPYIVINDRSKVAALQRLLPQRYRERPVLVASAG